MSLREVRALEKTGVSNSHLPRTRSGRVRLESQEEMENEPEESRGQEDYML